MTLLYDRVCHVTLQRAVQPQIGNVFVATRNFFTQLQDIVVITDLRVQFECKRTLGTSPNECKLTITNLPPTLRSQIEGPPEGLVVSVAAGHDNVPRHLFSGDVRLCFSEQDGADWHTEIHVADGGRAYARAKIWNTYRSGTPLMNVVKDVAKSMGLEMPKDVSLLRGIEIASGYAAAGDARTEMTRLLAPFGFSWSIQDGKLQLLRDDDTVGVVRDLSEDTGLIGSPSFEHTKGSKKKAARTKLTAQALLYPELAPGAVVRIESRQVDARFRVEEVSHKGDTHGEEWTTEIEAKELG